MQATIYKCNDDGTMKALQAYSDTDVSAQYSCYRSHLHVHVHACTCMWMCLHAHACG